MDHNKAYSLTLLVLMSLSAAVRSQDTAAIAECVPQLVPLAPCGPFVQGGALSPAQQCCDNLKQIYAQRPQCLCLLLNNSAALSSLPINASLAFQLPVLCSLRVDLSVCSNSGLSGPTSPASQVSLGSTGAISSTAVNATIPDSPASQLLPTPPHKSNGGINLKNNDSAFTVLVVMVVFITSVLTELVRI